MRGMILAAGLGTRLRPLTEQVPKPLLDVAGHPMIAYPLVLLRSAGIHEVIINTHHLGEQIPAALGDGSRFGMRLTYSHEDPILDTGGGIRRAAPFLRGGRFVVVNADTVIDLDLPATIDFHEAKGAVATMVLRRDPQASRYGVIETDRTQRIRRILGEPGEVDAPLEPFMFCGVHVFEPEVFEWMEEGAFSITRATYPRMRAAGRPLYGYPFAGDWAVLDTPDGLEQGRERLARGEGLRAALRP